MSIASRITSIEEHITNAYTSMDNLGIDISSTNKNIYNISTLLDTLYERLPKVSGIGASLSLSPSMVGKIKLNEIQGNTLQNGTPTPSSPVPIQSVTGLQNVVISNSDSSSSNTYEVNLGKNLLDKSTLQEGYVTSTGTLTNTSPLGEMHSDFIKVQPNTTYTFKIFEISGTEYANWMGIGEYTANNISSFVRRDTMSTETQRYFTFTTSSTTQYVIVSARNLENATKVQLEKGNGTSYSPYFTPIELNKIGDYEDSIKKSTGKNMLDTSNFYKGYVNSSGVVTSDNVQALFDYVEVEPSGTYTISSQGTVASLNIVQYDANKNFISRTVQSNNPKTFTLGNTTYYVRIWTKVSDSTPMTQEVIDGLKLMLEQNNQATTYEPYGKVWYITYNTREKTFNGSETWSLDSTGYIAGTWLNDIVYVNSTSYVLGGYSNRYVAGSLTSARTNSNHYGVYDNGNYNLWLNAQNKSITDFKTWLSTNNVTIIYPLATPTYEVITNTDLIQELETLSKAKSKNGTTNINVTSEDLSMLLNVGVLKGDA